MIDHYQTLVSPAEATLKVERSEFVALAFPLKSEAEFTPELARVSKKFFDATHHCWAWRRFDEGSPRARSSDAGEPSGTAGRPILSAIEGGGLHDIGLIVVRYYGGIKLGTGGLSRAYRDAAQAVLAEVQRADRYLYDQFEVEVPFAALNTAYRLISPPDIVLAAEDFGELNRFRFDVRRSRADAFISTLVEKRLRYGRVAS